MINEKLLIIGCGGHARFVASTLIASKIKIMGFIDLDPNFDPKEEILGHKVIDSIENIDRYILEGIVNLFIAIGNNESRREIYNRLQNAGAVFPNVIHPLSSIADGVLTKMGDGNIVGPGCVLGADVSLGSNNIINSGAIVEHNAQIGNHCHVSLNAALAGNVSISDGVFVSAGATIINDISISENITIGAGAVVLDNLNKKNSTYVGIPAKKI